MKTRKGGRMTPPPTPAGGTSPVLKHNPKTGQTAWVSNIGGKVVHSIPWTEMNLPKNLQNSIPYMQQFAAVNNMLPPEKRITIEKVSNFAKENVQKVFPKLPALSDGSGSKGSMNLSSGGGSESAMSASYGLSKAPNPRPVNLNSGIIPNAYANDYMLPTELLCAPLHVSNVVLTFPTDVTNSLNSYILNTVIFDIQTRAQANVGFNLDVASTFSAANILVAMNSVIRALQVYYFYSSILAYESDPRNKNAGMIAARSIITPQLLSDLTQLGRRLEDTPCPPRLVQWIRYMNMNFLSGDSQGSPLLKLGCNPDCFTTVTATSLAASALTGLTNSNSIYTLLRRAIPQWRIGKLYDVPVTPVYDKNFLTIFANVPSFYVNSSVNYYYPKVTAATDNISYNSFNNRLDGAAYAMTSAVVGAGSVWFPGLVYPSASSTQFSRQSYYSVSGVANFYNVSAYDFLKLSRLESYQIPAVLTNNAVTLHLSGADKAQGVSINSITQTAQNFVDFLVNVDSIPLKGTLNSFNKNGSGKI